MLDLLSIFFEVQHKNVKFLCKSFHINQSDIITVVAHAHIKRC